MVTIPFCGSIKEMIYNTFTFNLISAINQYHGQESFQTLNTEVQPRTLLFHITHGIFKDGLSFFETKMIIVECGINGKLITSPVRKIYQ